MYNEIVFVWNMQNNQGLGKGYHLYLKIDYSGYDENLIQ